MNMGMNRTAGTRSGLMRLAAVLAVPLLLAACASEPEELPPPPVVAVEPPTAAEVEATYVILFDFASTGLTGAGQVVVADLVALAQSDPALTIQLIGHADSVGATELNLSISRARAETVRNALVANGVPTERITLEGRGESELAVPTGDNVRNQANRRVVATLL